METSKILLLILAALLVAGGIIYYIIHNRKKTGGIANVDDEKKQQGKIILYAGLGILLLFIVVGGLVTVLNPNSFLKNVSATIIICWLVILVAYYSWAIYFYNINLGWSDDKWDRHRSKQSIDPTGTMPSPNENPNSEETMGLPPGTVRGTLALTLLVVAVALVVASLGEETTIKSNSVLADHFEFIKNAFLMMIAFYFGSKGLESLKGDAPQIRPHSDSDNQLDSSQKPAVDTNLSEEEQRAIESNFNLPGSQG